MRDPFARVEIANKSLPMPGTAAVLQLLAQLVEASMAQSAQSAELVAEVRGLRADLAAFRAMPPIAACGADYAELLHAISASSGGRVFSVADLLLRAEVVADRAEDCRLRDAIVAALGEVNGKRLGQLLRRVEGADIDSLCVARVGRARDGVSWRVATLEPEKVAKAVAQSR